MAQKSVAIIGAGQAGLASAKYALENGLKPTIFEKSGHIGGLWAPGTAIWNDLYANVSKYTMMFSDHPWPKNTPIFGRKNEIQRYLETYADRFQINKHIRLNSQITAAKQIDQNKWKLDYLHLGTNQAKSDKFDHLIIASGQHTKPRTPQFRNDSNYKGQIMHSSQFQLNDPNLKEKNVLLLGFNVSGIDISTNLVGHAKSITNVLSRPYLVAPRLIATKLDARSKFVVTPFDLYFYKRCIAFQSKQMAGLSKEEKKLKRKQFLQSVFSQTNKLQTHPALFFDVDDEKQETLMTISDSYLELVEQNKITPKRTSILEFTENGVHLEDGSFQPANVVIYCTGYEVSLDYLDKSVVDKLKIENEANYKFQYNLHKFTFHPDVENFAMVGQIDGLFFTGSELQARLASMVFSEKIKYDTNQTRSEIEKQKSKIKSNKRRAQFPYGTYVEVCDTLAKEMNLVPDLERMKVEEPQLYDLFWNASLLSAHYLYGQNKRYTVDLMREVQEMTSREYDYQSENDLKFSNVLQKFKNSYNFQNRF
jgi:dimethylaniline monooxygenase (N-oxide forming)